MPHPITTTTSSSPTSKQTQSRLKKWFEKYNSIPIALLIRNNSNSIHKSAKRRNRVCFFLGGVVFWLGVFYVLLLGLLLSSSSSSLSPHSTNADTDKVAFPIRRESTTIRNGGSTTANYQTSRKGNNKNSTIDDKRNHTVLDTGDGVNTNNRDSTQIPSFAMLYNQESDEEILERLPGWIRDYVEWHARMRRQFPGMQLFTHPDAPPLLVRTCLGLCGGLHDRLGQLPWDLYLGNATRRVILIAWQRPRALQEFLVPNHPKLLDWTIPDEFQFGFDDMHRVRNVTALFQGFSEDQPAGLDFWTHDVDVALERATTTTFAHHKILRHRILGHLGEQALQERLDRLSSTAEKVHSAPHFGRIFWLFFRPSPAVETWIQTVVATLQLQPRQYSAVHCRVRHPKATNHGWHVLGKNPNYPADKTGLPWEGATRQFALDVATTALNCSRLIFGVAAAPKQNLPLPPPPPVYFLSDSNDLVRHVAVELTDPRFVTANRTILDQTLYQLVQRGDTILDVGSRNAPPPSPSSLGWIRARDVTEETAHLDRQKGRQASSYYSTFVDLMLVIHAHCVVYGIGYYASFGAKISATPCQYIYQQEEWGHQVAKSAAQICPNVVEDQEGEEE